MTPRARGPETPSTLARALAPAACSPRSGMRSLGDPLRGLPRRHPPHARDGRAGDAEALRRPRRRTRARRSAPRAPDRLDRPDGAVAGRPVKLGDGLARTSWRADLCADGTHSNDSPVQGPVSSIRVPKRVATRRDSSPELRIAPRGRGGHFDGRRPCVSKRPAAAASRRPARFSAPRRSRTYRARSEAPRSSGSRTRAAARRRP